MPNGGSRRPIVSGRRCVLHLDGAKLMCLSIRPLPIDRSRRLHAVDDPDDDPRLGQLCPAVVTARLRVHSLSRRCDEGFQSLSRASLVFVRSSGTRAFALGRRGHLLCLAFNPSPTLKAPRLQLIPVSVPWRTRPPPAMRPTFPMERPSTDSTTFSCRFLPCRPPTTTWATVQSPRQLERTKLHSG